jgi:hypothetical protein
MEDLVLALVRQHGQVGLKNTAQAIASDRPLRALWDAEITFAWGVIAMEFSALAVHYEQVRQEMKRNIEDLRNLQTEGVARHFQLRGIVSPIPPMQLTIIVAAIARQLLREKEFGVSLGHAEMVAMVEEYVDGLVSNEDSNQGGSVDH